VENIDAIIKSIETKNEINLGNENLFLLFPPDIVFNKTSFLFMPME
jgi:L-serine dehydratase